MTSEWLLWSPAQWIDRIHSWLLGSLGVIIISIIAPLPSPLEAAQLSDGSQNKFLEGAE